MYNRKSIGRVQVENFLSSHKDDEGDKYGWVGSVNGERVIIPSDKYLMEMEF